MSNEEKQQQPFDPFEGIEPDDQPVAEMEPKQRLGVLLRRYRHAADKSLEETAKHLNTSPITLGEVEKGLAALTAAQLQELAAYLKVRYEPLLEAAKDWSRAIWDKTGKEAVKLESIEATETSLHGGETALEAELIVACDELTFVSNVMREGAVRAEAAARKIRGLLRARGMMIAADEEVKVVNCDGPIHADPKRLRIGRDFAIRFEPEDDGEGLRYFCSQECADTWNELTAGATVQ